MKKFLVLAVVMMSANVMAGERLILDDQKEMNAEVNATTVLCSAKGYGLEELKINIKGLDGWTILDHSNIRFGDRSGLPCMTAGMCKPWGTSGKGFEVEDVVQNNPRVEKVVVKRKLFEIREVFGEGDEQGCFRNLREELETTVGGIPFHHKRFSTQEKLPTKACTF